MVKILYAGLESEVPEAEFRSGELWLPIDALPSTTGWRLEPHGLCRGDVCVPITGAGRDWVQRGRCNLSALARHMGQEMAAEGTALAAFSEPGARQSGPVSSDAPDFALPDLDGRVHRLSDYRGRKVLLYAWASY
jgi:hypothetical protein